MHSKTTLRSRLGIIVVPLGLAAGLLLADASARPTAAPTRGAAPTICPSPDAAQCLTPGYLDTACGQKHLATCKPHVLAALENDPARSTAPTIKMLRPKLDDIPKDVRTGHLMARYKGPARVKRPSSKNNLLVRTQLSRAANVGVDPKVAAKAHRQPAWDANGQKVTSCQEYAYEKLYDWTRFTDAVAVCAGDHDCVFDVAYLSSTPGIARRKLQRKDGKPLAAQFRLINQDLDVIPKNEMFSYLNYIYVGGPAGVAKTAALDEAESALEQGKRWYSFKCGRGGCSSRQFVDEWDFHEKLRKRNAPVSLNEFEEYDRRKAEFRNLVAQHQAAVTAEMAKMKSKLGRGVQLPFDEISPDPVQWMNFMQSRAKQIETLRSGSSAKPSRGLESPKVRNPGRVAPSPAVPSTPMQKVGRRAPVAAAGVLASTAPQPASGSPVTTSKDPCAPHLWMGVTIAERHGVGPISCRLGEFLRKEWKRKLAGQKSCLDLSDDDCDWSPSFFEGRFVAGLPYIGAQAKAENTCMLWTDDNFGTGKANLTAAEEFIETQRKLIQAAKGKLAPYAMTGGTSGQKYGKKIGDSWEFGDRGWFAGGYAYAFEWQVEPIEKASAGQICALTGSATGKASASAWLGNKHISLADGELRSVVNDPSDGAGPSFHAHLTVLGIDVFEPHDSTYTQVFEQPVIDKKTSFPPKGARPQFQSGILTGSLWGELRATGKLAMSGSMDSTGCDPKAITFGMKTTFEPEFAADGRAQVGVGISGIASAGVRGRVNIVTLGLPMHMTLKVSFDNNSGGPALAFDGAADLLLATLSGRISLYIEYTISEDEWELFSWKGVGPKTIELMKLDPVSLPMAGMK